MIQVIRWGRHYKQLDNCTREIDVNGDSSFLCKKVFPYHAFQTCGEGESALSSSFLINVMCNVFILDHVHNRM